MGIIVDRTSYQETGLGCSSVAEHLLQIHKTLGLMPRTTEHSLPFKKGIFHFSYTLKPVGKVPASVVILVCTGQPRFKT